MLIHVVKPSGVRFEVLFPDGASDARVLGELSAARLTFGRVEKVDKEDQTGRKVPHDDPNSPLAWDDPAFRVVEVVPEGDSVREIRVLRGVAGPPGAVSAPKPANSAPPAPPASNRPPRKRPRWFAPDPKTPPTPVTSPETPPPPQ